jgi:hypothetical protein
MTRREPPNPPKNEPEPLDEQSSGDTPTSPPSPASRPPDSGDTLRRWISMKPDALFPPAAQKRTDDAPKEPPPAAPSEDAPLQERPPDSGDTIKKESPVKPVKGSSARQNRHR